MARTVFAKNDRCRMLNQRTLVLFGIVVIGGASAWSQQRGGVLKPGEGDRLPGERRTFVKASSRTGTQGVEMFRGSEVVAKKRRLTLEEWNRISEKHGTTHTTIE